MKKLPGNHKGERTYREELSSAPSAVHSPHLRRSIHSARELGLEAGEYGYISQKVAKTNYEDETQHEGEPKQQSGSHAEHGAQPAAMVARLAAP